MSGRGFAAVPSWLVEDESVSGHAKITYLVLMSHHSEGGDVFPSHARIATLAGISVSSVQRALRELRELGVVEWEQGDAKHGGRGSNTYQIRTTRPRRKASTLGHPDRPPRSGGPTPSVTVTDELEPGIQNQGTRAEALDLEIEEGPRIIPSRKPVRPDVERLAIEGTRVFAISDEKARVDANARRIAEQILDERKVTPEQVVEILRWASSDAFWGPKVLTWSKFREHFVQLRKQASVTGPARASAAATAAAAGRPDPARPGADPLERDDHSRAMCLLSRGIEPAEWWRADVDPVAALRRVRSMPRTWPGDLDELVMRWENRDSMPWPALGWTATERL